MDTRPSAVPDEEQIAEEPVAPSPAPQDARNQLIGYGLAAVGAILFSTKAVAIKLAYQDPIDAETLLALRMILATPFYVAVGLYTLRGDRAAGRPAPKSGMIGKAIAIGLLGYWVASYLDFLGLEYISAQVERLILFTYPIFVVIFGALFFRQKITRRIVIAVAISYAGLAIIFTDSAAGGGRDAMLGAALVLGCAVAFALYQLFAKTVIDVMGPKLFTCVAMSAAAVAAVAQFLFTHPVGDLMVSQRLWLISLFLAVGSTVLPSFFLNAALHRISAQANATIGTLSPVATIILAWAILGETLSLTAWIGTALVLAGVGWFTLSGRRR